MNSRKDIIHPSIRFPQLEEFVKPLVHELTRQGRKRKIQHLVSVLNKAYFRLNPHKDPFSVVDLVSSNFMEVGCTAISFSSRDLRKWFGKNNYKDFIRPYFNFPEGDEGYHFGGTYYYLIEDYIENHPDLDLDQEKVMRFARAQLPRLTKAYTLKQETIKKLDEIWSEKSGATVYDKNSQLPISPADLPPNGICATSFSKIEVPPLLEFDVSRLDETIRKEEELASKNYELGKGIDYLKQMHLRHLYRARKWIVSFGGIPNLYRDYEELPTDKNGRLWGIGSIHVQNMKREVRDIIYSGKGWYDYDFRKCHFAILASLAMAYGYETKILNDYASQVQDFDSQIASALGVDKAKVKTILTSLIFSAPVSAHVETSIGRSLLFNEDTVKKLRDNEIVIGLINDIRLVRDEIIHSHTDYESQEIFNVVGKRKSIRLEDKKHKSKISKPQMLSYILTGYEAWAVNVACESKSNILAVMHDGFVASDSLDMLEIQNKIYYRSINEFGYPLMLTLKETIK